jgi:hypothetical protein
MYPAIIFFFALFVSLQALNAVVLIWTKAEYHKDQGKRSLRLDFLSCVLWAWFFYLVH